MSWPIYSETFIRTLQMGAWTRYNVPPGKRAIVKNFVLVASTQIAWSYTVMIHGVLVGYGSFPATPRTESVSLFAVAYGGEAIECYASGGTVSQTVSGYLFNDTAGASLSETELCAHPLEIHEHELELG